MSYLNRMLTCPECGRKVSWRETVADDGTCRRCADLAAIAIRVHHEAAWLTAVILVGMANEAAESV